MRMKQEKRKYEISINNKCCIDTHNLYSPFIMLNHLENKSVLEASMKYLFTIIVVVDKSSFPQRKSQNDSKFII